MRLADAPIARLQRSCGEANYNISDIILQAPDSFLGSDVRLAPSTGPAPHLHPPEEILTAVRKCFAWGAGD